MSTKLIIKVIITVTAICLAVAHIIFPAIKIDIITVSLTGIAIIPWLEQLFKSVGLPGGISFQFHDLENLADDAEKAGLIPDSTGKEDNESLLLLPDYQFVEIASKNKKTSLLTLWIEIEKSIRTLSASHSIDSKKYPVLQLLYILEEKNILKKNEVAVLEKMSVVFNQPVTDRENDRKISNWVTEKGPRLIYNLDKKINHTKS